MRCCACREFERPIRHKRGQVLRRLTYYTSRNAPDGSSASNEESGRIPLCCEAAGSTYPSIQYLRGFSTLCGRGVCDRRPNRCELKSKGTKTRGFHLLPPQGAALFFGTVCRRHTSASQEIALRDSLSSNSDSHSDTTPPELHSRELPTAHRTNSGLGAQGLGVHARYFFCKCPLRLRQCRRKRGIRHGSWEPGSKGGTSAVRCECDKRPKQILRVVGLRRQCIKAKQGSGLSF